MSRKKFAFISSDFANGTIEKADKLLMEEIKKRYDLIKLNPFEVSIKKNGESGRLFLKGGKVEKVDFALVRRTRGAREDVYGLVNYLEKNGTKVLDNSEQLGRPLSKFNGSKFIFKKPVSYFSNSLASLKKMMAGEQAWRPMIVKPCDGYQGKGIVKIDSKKELMETAADFFAKNNQGFYFQEYIEILHEYRVFVIGGRALGAVEKIAPEGCIAKNYSLGASFVQVERPEVVAMAEDVCQKTETNFSGVDIIEDEKGILYLLECNRSPQFMGFKKATGIKVEEKIIDYFAEKFKD